MPATSIDIKRASNANLLAHADKVGAELAKRICDLDEGLRKLGMDGLRLATDGKRRVLVQFPGYHKKYCYTAPIDARVGDTVKTPSSYTSSNQNLATIVELGDGGYTGGTKDVVQLYKAVK